jgi:LacI family transcriptional regulator, kdg operon repressor
MLLDNKKAAGIGVQHFIDRGYTKIGIITNVIRNVTPRMERIKGYKDTMKSNCLDIRDEYIKSLEVSRIKEGVRELLSLEDPPEAILAGNDLTLIEILKYVKEHNVKIPKDLAIIGIDDVSFAGFYEPGLTIVAQPTFEIGKKAAEFLLNKIQKKEDQDEGLVFRFDPKLINRESC